MRKRAVDYSSNIADMMSGLAIIFILLFIILIIIFGQKLRKETQVDDKQIVNSEINAFLKEDGECAKYCSLCKEKKVARMENEDVGVYFTAVDEIFASGSSRFGSKNAKDNGESKKKEVACVVRSFLKNIALSEKGKKKIAKIFFEAKGDFSLGENRNKNTESKNYLHFNDKPCSNFSSLCEIKLTLERSYELIKLIGYKDINDTIEFNEQEQSFLSTKISAAGLGWGNHLEKMSRPDSKTASNALSTSQEYGNKIALQEDPTERSIQIRVLLHN